MKVLKYIIILLLFSAVISSCKKKEDFTYDDRLTSVHFANSSARVVNISGYDQLALNGKPLTNFLSQFVGNVPPIQGTLYFPATGRFDGNGTTWYIPQNLISGGSASVMFRSLPLKNGDGSIAPGDTTASLSFNAIDNFNNPIDYYAIFYGPHLSNAASTDTVFAIPRSVSAPTDPTHFKIRVLNLSDNDDQSNLKGPLTLTYADGTVVNSVTSNVKQGQYSDYIELPYGSYQFKLQTQSGAELPGANTTGREGPPIAYVDPNTGVMVDGYNNFVNNVFAPIQTYEPGGVYTVVASVNGTFIPYTDEGQVYINSFRTIADISVPVNLTYARAQAVNVIPGTNINVTVDGKPLASALAFSAHTDYQVYVKGDHDVKVTDQTGNVLAERTLTVQGNDVWTAWVYQVNGKANIAFATNNMSGKYYFQAAGDDEATGTNAGFHYGFTSPLRFLNFCQDLPFATFTDENGQQLQQNLAPGQVVTSSVYTLGAPAQIRVYQSQLSPLIVPGNWLSNITSLAPADFIANKTIYSTGNFTGLPPTEFGVYSVALVGNLNATLPGQSAHLIIIKHNK